MTASAGARPPGSLAFRVLPPLVVALFALRVALATLPGLWIDEVFSLQHALGPLSGIWGEGWRLESSPPLYYFTLWVWVRLVGDGEVAARMLSVLLTVVSTLLVRRAAVTLAGREAGWIATACWLLPALAVEYSVEIRPYALVGVLVAAATAALARALVDHRTGRIVDARGTARAVAPIVLAAAAMFYAHTTTFSVIAGLAAAAAFHGWRTRASAGYARAWAAGCAATAVLCLPQLVFALGVIASNRAGLAWIPSSFDPHYVSWVLREWVIGQVAWPAVASVPVAVGVFAAIAAAAAKVRDRVEVIAVGAVLPAVGAFALWIAGVNQAILMHRTLLWTWIPVAVLLGCAAVRLGRRPLLAAGAVALAISASTTATWIARHDLQRPWHAALRELEAKVRPGDRLLLLDPEVGCLVARYAGPAVREAPRVRLRLPTHPPPDTGQRIALGCNELPEVGLADVGSASPAGDWLLTGDDRQRRDARARVAELSDRLVEDDAVSIGPFLLALRVSASRSPR
ncbi:MAG: glycosyltransferase family 39 protein [Burkholderiales bacterium]